MPNASTPVMPGNRVINGTWGEVWRNGEKWIELSACQAKFSYNKSDINICGQMAVDTKVTGVKGTGSITVFHVYSRNYERANQLLDGIDQRDTIIMKLADPDSFGAERVALYNVSFDDETMMDFKAGTVAEKTYPFTFTGREWLDHIEPR